MRDHKKLLHVEHSEALQGKAELNDVINLLQDTIETSAYELERKLIRIITTYFGNLL